MDANASNLGSTRRWRVGIRPLAECFPERKFETYQTATLHTPRSSQRFWSGRNMWPHPGPADTGWSWRYGSTPALKRMINSRRGNQGQSAEHSNSHNPRSEGRAGCRSCACLRGDDEAAEWAVSAKSKAISEGLCISAYSRGIPSFKVAICDLRRELAGQSRTKVANCDLKASPRPVSEISPVGVYWARRIASSQYFA